MNAQYSPLFPITLIALCQLVFGWNKLGEFPIKESFVYKHSMIFSGIPCLIYTKNSTLTINAQSKNLTKNLSMQWYKDSKWSAVFEYTTTDSVTGIGKIDMVDLGDSLFFVWEEFRDTLVEIANTSAGGSGVSTSIRSKDAKLYTGCLKNGVFRKNDVPVYSDTSRIFDFIVSSDHSVPIITLCYRSGNKYQDIPEQYWLSTITGNEWIKSDKVPVGVPVPEVTLFDIQRSYNSLLLIAYENETYSDVFQNEIHQLHVQRYDPNTNSIRDIFIDSTEAWNGLAEPLSFMSINDEPVLLYYVENEADSSIIMKLKSYSNSGAKNLFQYSFNSHRNYDACIPVITCVERSLFLFRGVKTDSQKFIVAERIQNNAATMASDTFFIDSGCTGSLGTQCRIELQCHSTMSEHYMAVVTGERNTASPAQSAVVTVYVTKNTAPALTTAKSVQIKKASGIPTTAYFLTNSLINRRGEIPAYTICGRKLTKIHHNAQQLFISNIPSGAPLK